MIRVAIFSIVSLATLTVQSIAVAQEQVSDGGDIKSLIKELKRLNDRVAAIERSLGKDLKTNQPNSDTEIVLPDSSQKKNTVKGTSLTLFIPMLIIEDSSVIERGGDDGPMGPISPASDPGHAQRVAEYQRQLDEARWALARDFQLAREKVGAAKFDSAVRSVGGTVDNSGIHVTLAQADQLGVIIYEALRRTANSSGNAAEKERKKVEANQLKDSYFREIDKCRRFEEAIRTA